MLLAGNPDFAECLAPLWSRAPGKGMADLAETIIKAASVLAPTAERVKAVELQARVSLPLHQMLPAVSTPAMMQ